MFFDKLNELKNIQNRSDAMGIFSQEDMQPYYSRLEWSYSDMSKFFKQGKKECLEAYNNRICNGGGGYHPSDAMMLGTMLHEAILEGKNPNESYYAGKGTSDSLESKHRIAIAKKAIAEGLEAPDTFEIRRLASETYEEVGWRKNEASVVNLMEDQIDEIKYVMDKLSKNKQSVSPDIFKLFSAIYKRHDWKLLFPLEEKHEVEKELYGTYLNLDIRGKLDFIHHKESNYGKEIDIYDLKTTSWFRPNGDNPKRFIEDSLYDLQATLYKTLAILNGYKVRNFFFVVVSTSFPYSAYKIKFTKFNNSKLDEFVYALKDKTHNSDYIQITI